VWEKAISKTFESNEQVLPFYDLNSEEINQLYNSSDVITDTRVNEDFTEENLPFYDLNSEEINQLYNVSDEIMYTNINGDESRSFSLSSEEMSENITLPLSSNTNNNTSSTSEKYSVFLSNNPSSSGKDSLEMAEKLFYKNRYGERIRSQLSEIPGAYSSRYDYEGFVASRFESCSTVEELYTQKELLISYLKQAASIVREDISEDKGYAVNLFSNTTPLSPAEIHYLSSEMMDHFARETMMEGDIFRVRSDIVDLILDSHLNRITEFDGLFPEGSLEQVERYVLTGD